MSELQESTEDAGPTGIGPDRLKSFTDGVFAIAITLLVLNIELDSSQDLGHELVRMWPTLVAYVVTFLIVGVIWMNHHVMFHYIVRVDRPLLILNLLLLMSVSFLCWPTAVLADAMVSGKSQELAAALYGGTLVIGGIFFNAIWFYAAHEHRLLGEHITPEQARRIGRQYMVGPCFYLVATLVGLISAEASLIIYGLLLAAYMFEARPGPARSASS